MAREINRLTTKSVAALREPGLHADGAGLYLRIDQTLARRWVFVFFWRKKRREMGLGSGSSVSLKDAREAADDARRLLSRGLDPIEARRLAAAAASPKKFGDVAEELIEQLRPGWKGGFTADQWLQSLQAHAADIWHLSVAEVQTSDVIDALKPIWTAKHETARKLRPRIERVLDAARVKGYRSGENPARWRGHLQLLLPRVQHQAKHHTALPYEDLPDFMALLRTREATSARALEWTILSVARTSVTVEATWPEIKDDIWVIPAERMKAPRDHRVPITPRMAEILEEMRPLAVAADGLIFPGEQRIEPLSNNAMLNLLERMKVEVTVHGFRSTFKDWAEDCTQHANVVIEQALAHAVGDAVERAYRRRDALAKRRILMDDWDRFCATPPSEKVIQFPRV